jgi:hypothetical protein
MRGHGDLLCALAVAAPSSHDHHASHSSHASPARLVFGGAEMDRRPLPSPHYSQTRRLALKCTASTVSRTSSIKCRTTGRIDDIWTC